MASFVDNKISSFNCLVLMYEDNREFNETTLLMGISSNNLHMNIDIMFRCIIFPSLLPMMNAWLTINLI